MPHGSSQPLSIETSDPSVTDAIELAVARLRTARMPTPPPAGPPAEDAWIGLAALALGDHDAGRETVRRLGDRLLAFESGLDRAAGDSGRPLLNVDALSIYLLLVARCFAWTADHALLLAEWPRIDRALAAGRPAGTHAPSPAIRSAALRELANAASDVGRPADGAKLLRAAGEQAAADSDSHPGVALVLGSATPEVIAEWLCVRAMSSEGWTRALHGPIEAAMRLAAFVHGVLGAEPDAARQRLALRPCLPEDWTSVRVANLCVGDAFVAMRYTADGVRRTFTFEQVAGAVPLRLAFEPVLPVSSARVAAEVDGAAAELDARPFHGRVVVPVQLVLDHERTVSFES